MEKKRRHFFLLTLCIIQILEPHAKASINGYGKLVGAWQKDKEQAKHSSGLAAFHLELQESFKENVFFETAADLTLAKQSLSELDQILNSQYRSIYHLTDPKKEIKITPQKPYAVYPNIDRLAFTVEQKDLQVTLGRSAYSYGLARVFPASYLMAPPVLANIALEHISGHDGIKLSYQKNSWPKVDLVHFTSSFKQDLNSISLVRVQSLKASNQFETLLGQVNNIGFFGLSNQKSFSEISLWGDYGLIFAQEKPLSRLSLGGEYFFSSLNKMSFEYHFNELDVSNIDQEEDNNNYLSKKTYLFLKDKHYFSLQWNNSPYPLIQNYIQVLSKAKLKESLWAFKSSINFKENSYLELTAIFTSHKKNLKNDSTSLEWHPLGTLFMSSISYYW